MATVVTVPCNHPHKASGKSDVGIARKSMREEQKTIKDYATRGKQAKNPKVKAALSEAREDEMEHADKFHEAAESAAHERAEKKTGKYK